MRVPQRIEVQEGEQVTITWEDGSTTVIGARELRAACRCASCREPAGQAATRAVVGGEEQVRIREARLVGAYALSFLFDPDAHGTGIYTFEALQELGEGP